MKWLVGFSHVLCAIYNIICVFVCAFLWRHWHVITILSQPSSLQQLCPVTASTQPLVMATRHSHDTPQLEFPHLPPEWRDRYKKGQMYSFREQLMKLPVPSLQQTLDKYIASVEVCVCLCVCTCM